MTNAELRQLNKTAVQKSARELFAENGVAQTTVAQIAEKAGVTVRSINNYFSGKEEIMLLVLESIAKNEQASFKEFTEKLLATGLSGAAMLQKYIDYEYKYYCDNIFDYTLKKEIPNSLGFDEKFGKPAAYEKSSKIYRLKQEFIKYLLEKGKIDGSIPKDKPTGLLSQLIYVEMFGCLEKSMEVEILKKNFDPHHIELLWHNVRNIIMFLIK